jgi:glycosidase
MVNEAHRLGFKVIIDWVANHTGWDHIWTKTHPEFYLKDPDGKFISLPEWMILSNWIIKSGNASGND